MPGIVTFYSYKGGVGRSMALANVALLLARKGRRVLMVDWDLEAPGLERYFKEQESVQLHSSSNGGLLNLLLAMQRGTFSYKDYISVIQERSAVIDLLTSGRELDPAFYASELGRLDWEYVFSNANGGYHFEQLRRLWLQEYDWVLIDSRTGLSDASGICTILMPDVLIPMFTANYQSLFGVRDTLTYIRAARQSLNVDRMALTVLPVPSRFGTRIEFKQSQEWLDQIAAILKDSLSDWLPKWIPPKAVIENVKIPQVDYFGFGERLAVAEQSTSDPESMAFVYQKIANLLDSEFQDVAGLVGQDYFDQMKAEYQQMDRIVQEDGGYDVFIVYSRDSYSWISNLFLPALFEYLQDDLGRDPRIFFDASELNMAESWSEKYNAAIYSSKTLLIINDFKHADREAFRYILASYEAKERLTDSRLIFEVLIGGEGTTMNRHVRWEHGVFDLSDFTGDETLRSTKLRTEFGSRVAIIAKEIALSVGNPRGVMSAQPETPYSSNEFNLLQLAKEYDFLRTRLPSGSQRTSKMETIVRKMKTILAESEVDFLKFASSDSAGERLIAIAGLQAKPRLDQLQWLTEHVGDIEKPFVGYQASVALYIATRTFRRSHHKEVSQALTAAQRNIRKYAYQDPNQLDILKNAKRELTGK